MKLNIQSFQILTSNKNINSQFIFLLGGSPEYECVCQESPG